MAEKEIDFHYLQEIIVSGIKKIQINAIFKQAVFFLGDTGVGKSTLMTYIMGEKLRVSQIGLKPTLCGPEDSKIKIGHQKYSETSVPNQVPLDDKVFYDCPGFNDNKSRECDIANSFYLQRLFDLYEKAKIVIIIDQSYLTEARADRLPALIGKLQESFEDIYQILPSTLLVINRCNSDFNEKQIKEEFMKLLGTEKLTGFGYQCRDFLTKLLNNSQYFIFPSPNRNQIGELMPGNLRQKLMKSIENLKYTNKSISIHNIISDNAKLAIRDYIDGLAMNTDSLNDNLFRSINRVVQKSLINKTESQLFQIKEIINYVVDSRDDMFNRQDFEGFINFCEKIEQSGQLLDNVEKMKEQLKIIYFFKGVYDKTTAYYHNLASGILAKFSLLLLKIDKQIQKKKSEREEKERQIAKRKQSQETLKKQESFSETQKQPTIAQSFITSASFSKIQGFCDTDPLPELFTLKKLPMDRSYSITVDEDISKSNNPALAFQKKLIEAQYRMKELRYQGETMSHKMQAFIASSGRF